MKQIIHGSLCYTDIVAAAKAGHSAFTRASNNKVYFNFTQFINEEPDNHNNDSSLLLNSTKEKKEAEGKIYIGNGRFAKAPAPLTPQEVAADDDLPF